MADLEGKIQLQSDLVPVNDNPKQPVTDVKYVKGAPQVFLTIDGLVAFHPNRMKPGMSARILDYPAIGVITEFNLNRDPSELLDVNNASVVTLDNFTEFWEATDQKSTTKNRVTQYASDQAGGASPTFPYTVATESQWDNTLDPSKGHRWFRYRTGDADTDGDGIFDNWTAPIPLGNSFQGGDYIENRFKRVAVSAAQHSGIGTMTIDKYYVVESGTVKVNGDESLAKLLGTDENGDVTLTIGRTFQYLAAATYTFSTAVVVEVIAAPPRSINGALNNEPAGWTDTIPAGTDQLWQIFAQKSAYGQLKTAWQVKRINEDPNYIRYNNATSPHPDSLVGVATSAATGTQGDTDLNNAGWVAVYNNQDFIATREDDANPGQYTAWNLEKINEESGEYTDRVFKLFDINLDSDDPSITPPSSRDAINDGWSDQPVTEKGLKINYVSEARKFIDGSLKTPWSAPVPFSGKDTFNDTISSDIGDEFKKDKNGAVVPAQLTLTAKLHKGLTKLWTDSANNISYAWERVYNNGATDNTAPAAGSDFALIETTSGTDGDDDYLRANQRVVIKPGGVTGKAVFRCVQTLTLESGSTIVFTSEYSVLDVADGKDAKALVLSADKQLILYDTTNTAWLPTKLVMRAYQSNLASPTFNFYRLDGAVWTKLTGAETGYSISGNKLTIDLATAALFAADGTAQGKQFAVSTDGTSPDNADFDTIFSDYIDISKTAANAVSNDGEHAVAAILEDSNSTLILDATSGDPVANEIGVAGRIKTKITLFEGATKQTYGDWSVSVPTSDNGNVTFAIDQAGTDDPVIYISSWGTGETKAKATVTITFGTVVFTKTFTVSTTKDAPGALVLDLDCDTGYAFTPESRADKTLIANLYDTNKNPELQTAGYEYRFTLNGALLQDWSTDRDVVLARSSVNAKADLLVEVRLAGSGNPALRSRSVRIYDVVDGRSYRLYSDNATIPAKPTDTVTPDAGDANWSPDSTNAKWAVDGEERWPITTPSDAGKYDWGTPYQLGGEDGGQGPNGDFFFPMYKSSSSDPGLPNGNQSTLAEMTNAGWTADVPGGTDPIWKTERRWTGEGVVFDVNGLPSTSASSGSTWTNPVKVSGSTGTKGAKGDMVETRFKKTSSSTPPATPVGNDPSGWAITPPSVSSSSDVIWASVGYKDSLGNLVGSWSAPVRWNGFPGTDGEDATKELVKTSYNRGSSYVDLGNSTSRKILITVWCNVSNNPFNDFSLTLKIGRGNTSSGGTSVVSPTFTIKQNSGNHHLMYNHIITTSSRYITVDGLGSNSDLFHYGMRVEVL